jgi:hypothetical protein
VRTLRKLVLGETWALPIGIALAVLAAVAIRAVAGPTGWWHQAGGWVLFGLLAVSLGVAVLRRPRR